MVQVKDLKRLLNNIPDEWELDIDTITIRLRTSIERTNEDDSVYYDDEPIGMDKRFTPNTIGLD